jgi:hypothetical protein
VAAIQKRREKSIATEHEESVRQQILDGLIADKGGDQQVSKATRILAEVIAPMPPGWWSSIVSHIVANSSGKVVAKSADSARLPLQMAGT